MFIFSPLDQFEINSVFQLLLPFNINIALTNIGIYFIFVLVLAVSFNLFISNRNLMIANSWSIMRESLYATIHNLVLNQIGGAKGQVYFPFIFSIFTLVLFSNFLGMIPYSFAVTSHLIFTLSLSLSILIGVTILGFNLHGLKFFSFFVPSGTPLALVPLLVLIELISYIAKGLSLGIRLGANVMSGHMLVKIIGGFIFNMMTSGIVMFLFGLVPLSILIGVMNLELAIAAIQSYVFTILTSSYIKDSIDLH